MLVYKNTHNLKLTAKTLTEQKTTGTQSSAVPFSKVSALETCMEVLVSCLRECLQDFCTAAVFS